MLDDNNHKADSISKRNVCCSIMPSSAPPFRNSSPKGFTILEVIISLVIVGLSITVFIKLLGTSTMFRSKINDYDERYAVAITKAEQTFLGLSGGGNVQSGDKLIRQGTVEGKDISWQIVEEKDEELEGNNKDLYFFTVTVDGIEISSVALK